MLAPFQHVWQPAYLDKKHLSFTNQINQPAQLDQLKVIRSSMTGMAMAYTIRYNTYVCLYREPPSIIKISFTGVPVLLKELVKIRAS